jgi:glycosyltransferase involved in cell wall biosynthesis
MAPAVTELSEALARQGHKVHLFTRMGEDEEALEVIEGVHYHRCAFDPGDGILEYCDNMADSMVERFYQVEKAEGGFDLIHGHDWHVIDGLDRIKKERGRPTFLTFHSTEWGRNGGEFGDWHEFREISGREWYGAYMANRILTVSTTMKGELDWLYQAPGWKVDVVPNGIRAERYQKDVDPGRVKERYGIHPLAPTILFIGRLVTQKGPDILMEAVPRVLAHRWDAKFVIAGDGGMKPHLEYLAQKNLVEGSVIFPGYISDEEYLDLLNASDVVCIPSRNEPFGLVLLEAWSAGKAVVATEAGGLGENIQNFENGILVQRSPESIAWGINYIIDDPGGVRYLGENGRNAAETYFNWDNIARMTVDVYKK